MGSGGEAGEGEAKVPAQQATGKYAMEPWKLQSEDDAAAAMKHVAAGAQKWHDTSPEQRIELLRDVRKRAIKASLELGRRNAKVLCRPLLRALDAPCPERTRLTCKAEQLSARITRLAPRRTG